MSSSYNFLLAVFLVVIAAANAQLSPTFYDSRCPLFAPIARSLVRSAIGQNHRMAAALLRLHFHDCFVQGCDASILLDDTPTFTGEKTAIPNNNSVRGYEVIDQIKVFTEALCPGVVSCADIVALAARDAVTTLFGPSWTVPFGRRDSITANITAANIELPSPFLNLSGLINAFSNKGFTASEMVTLSGAHTIGLARCQFFRNRIYNETNIDPNYAAWLQLNCSRTSGVGDDNLAALDVQSTEYFDNDYYQNLIAQSGLFHSDQELTTTAATTLQVATYSSSKETFFNDFSQAMIKMSLLSPLTGTQGQIRTNCRRVNPPTVGQVSGLKIASETGRASY